MHEKSWLRLLNSCSGNRKSKIQKRPRRLKWGGIVALGFAFAFGGAVAEAQQPTKIPRIGDLLGASPSAASACIEAFRQGLREL